MSRFISDPGTISFKRQIDDPGKWLENEYENSYTFNSGYKNDREESAPFFCKDLISWAFQVARGMEYITKKKVEYKKFTIHNFKVIF